MSSEEAAPLQCAGATTYSALVDSLNSGDRVSILGIGGLGHLAIQFASKLGATVVVISSSRSKEGETKSFGAHEFYLMDKVDKMPALVDVLVITGSGMPPFDKIFKTGILARG
ncbi:NAD(P)-binding protein [Polyplosphaeria fusca]|uniref:NAD(P)-binding protein n=1 Tax=Polyplosphaeria fusca TaxID=682080 RepID=A0A9P4QN82_9PLEO|nr:NAD(P)-binding protein [Polyplosphaeria fusca]